MRIKKGCRSKPVPFLRIAEGLGVKAQMPPAALRGLRGFYGFPEMLERNIVKRKHFRVSSATKSPARGNAP